MAESTPRALATINLAALRHNFELAQSQCLSAGVVPVIKANAYGHGVEQVARALTNSKTKPAAFAVATLDEALQLEKLDLGINIVLLAGCIDAEELAICINAGIEPVLQNRSQLETLQHLLNEGFLEDSHRFWLKVNTGMNRLGFPAEEVEKIYATLLRHPDVDLVLMSHLASADEGQSSAQTQAQIQSFSELAESVRLKHGGVCCSLAASSGILDWSQSHFDFIRPGIMLYGSSPLTGRSASDLKLQPVMTLNSRLVAINQVEAGEAIGYGATYICEQDTPIGVVSIGYADGYPRSARNGTPVLVQSGGKSQRVGLAGRVSMDMITIDLSEVTDPAIGDEVILWGEGLPVDEVASCANTIAYELFCKVTARVPFSYLEE